MNEKSKDFEHRFSLLLKIFKSKPKFFIKYLLENEAFTDVFISKILNSSKLKNAVENNEDLIGQHFSSIEDMQEKYTSLLEHDDKNISYYALLPNESLKDQQLRLNKLLTEVLKDEDYTKAINIKNYMIHMKMKVDPLK